MNTTARETVVAMVMNGETMRYFSYYNENHDFRFGKINVDTETYSCYSINSTHIKPLRPSTVLNNYKTISENEFLSYYKCVETLRAHKELREKAEALCKRMLERD